MEWLYLIVGAVLAVLLVIVCAFHQFSYTDKL